MKPLIAKVVVCLLIITCAAASAPAQTVKSRHTAALAMSGFKVASSVV